MQKVDITNMLPKDIFQLGDEAWKASEYDDARGFYQKAEKAYSLSNDPEGEVFSLSRLAELELSLENFNEAEKNLTFAIAIINNTEVSEVTHSDTLLRMAQVKSKEGKPLKALSHIEDSREIADRIGNYDLVGNSYDLEALIYLQTNKEKEALESYKKAAEAYNQSGTTLKEAATLRAIARLEIKNKTYEIAHDSLERCRELYRENGDLLGEASALSAIGSLRYIIKDITNARKALMKSAYLYGKVSHHFAEAEVLLYLARVDSYNKEEGDYKRAKTHYKRSIELFDFLDNQMMKEAVLSEYYEFLRKIGE